MGELEAVNCDEFQACDLGHEDAFADVDFGEFGVGIGIAEICEDCGCVIICCTIPGIVFDFFGGLLFVECNAIEEDVSAMVPLAVV